MNNIKTFEEFNHLDEGWRDVVVGTAMALSTILPTGIIANDTVNIDGDRYEYVITNENLSAQEVREIIGKLTRDGFKLDKPLGMVEIPEGDYIIASVEGTSYSKSLDALEHAIDKAIRNSGKKELELYYFVKKTEGLHHQLLKIEWVCVIKLVKNTYQTNVKHFTTPRPEWGE